MAEEDAVNLDLRPHWSLDPFTTFLNHGSFGAVPRRIQNHRADLFDEIEANPVRFFARQLPDRIRRARGELADFLGTSHQNLAFTTNTTEAVNAVLRSLDFGDGDEILITDHSYGACKNAVEFVARRTGASVQIAELPFPVEDPSDVTDAILAKTTENTRLAVIDHITAFSAMVLPIDDIVDQLDDRGVDTLVDGAHAPGVLNLTLDELDAAYYAGNCHKWLCAPRGAAFLRVRDDRLDAIRPLQISHGAGVDDPVRSRFHLEFDWTGTRDPTPWLCVPEVIQFLATLVPDGWDGIRQRNRNLALQARRMLLEVVGTEPVCPESMIGFAAAVELPADGVEPPESVFDTDPLQDQLFADEGIEVPIMHILEPPRRLLRVSAQLYNQLEDYEKLAEALG